MFSDGVTNCVWSMTRSHMHTYTHTCPVCPLPNLVTWPSLNWREQVKPSPHLLLVSRLVVLCSLCTSAQLVLLCYRTTSGICYTAKHLFVLLLALLSQPSTYASSCHWSYGKFYPSFITLLALHSHILYLHRCSSHPGSLSH